MNATGSSARSSIACPAEDRAHGRGAEGNYRRAGARSAIGSKNGDLHAGARGAPESHSPVRAKFKAAAVRACWRRVFSTGPLVAVALAQVYAGENVQIHEPDGFALGPSPRGR